jgi:4-hydroxy-4-methyl-2-oxoglutarate aldolase
LNPPSTAPTPGPFVLTEEECRALGALDSCSVANAIERFQIQLRNEGYLEGNLTCQFPELNPMLGYAATLQVRTSAPPTRRRPYSDDTLWWNDLLAIPQPRILVIQDMDRHPGVGAFVGHLQVEILRALGCAGVVTNGAVRELDRIKPLQFHLYSTTLSVSHGYSHVVSSGGRVQIGNLEINPGDILHGDRHGIIKAPRELASRLPVTAAALRQKEAEITAFCHSPEFSIDELRTLLNR